MSVPPDKFFDSIRAKVRSRFIFIYGDFVGSTIPKSLSEKLANNIKKKFPVLNEFEQFIIRDDPGIFIFLKINKAVGIGLYSPDPRNLGMTLIDLNRIANDINQQLKELSAELIPPTTTTIPPPEKQPLSTPTLEIPKPPKLPTAISQVPIRTSDLPTPAQISTELAETTEKHEAIPQVPSSPVAPESTPMPPEKIIPEAEHPPLEAAATPEPSSTVSSPLVTPEAVTEKIPFSSLIEVTGKSLFTNILHAVLLKSPIIIIEVNPLLTPHLMSFYDEILPKPMRSELEQIIYVTQDTVKEKQSQYKNPIVIDAVTNKVVYSPFAKEKLYYEPEIIKKALKVTHDSAQKLIFKREIEQLLTMVTTAIEIFTSGKPKDHLQKEIKNRLGIKLDKKLIPLIQTVAKAYYDKDIVAQKELSEKDQEKLDKKRIKAQDQRKMAARKIPRMPFGPG